MLRLLISFVIFVSLGIVGFHCTEDSKTQFTCPELQSMLTDMQKQLKDYKLVCKVNGILCSSFFCDLSANKMAKYQMRGSWQCQNSTPAFEFEVSYNESKQHVILDDSNRSNALSVHGLTITPSILFSTSAFRFNLTLKNSSNNNDLVNKIQTKKDILMNCKCSNIKSILTQVQSKFNVTSISCWGTNSSCSRYYCAGYIHKPEIIHFSFKGISYCDQVKKTPVYNLTLVVYHTKSILSSSRSLYFNETGEEDKITFLMEGKQELSLNLSYSYKTTLSGFTNTLIVSSAIKNKETSKVIKKLSASIDISFNDSNCEIMSTTKPTTTATKPTITTKRPTTTTKSTATTTKRPTTTTKSTVTTTKRPTITKKPKPTTKKPTTSTTKSSTIVTYREDNNKASHPAKAVLIVLSVLIILTVFFIGIYLKKRKKLSNQPAYYNDIALNDPLRYELEDEEQDDDDELPLFT